MHESYTLKSTKITFNAAIYEPISDLSKWFELHFLIIDKESPSLITLVILSSNLSSIAFEHARASAVKAGNHVFMYDYFGFYHRTNRVLNYHPRI